MLDVKLSHILVRGRAVRHKAIVRLFSGVAPFILVNEYPKSGGTWLAQMLSAAIGRPFRRNEPIRIEHSVTHGHFLSPLGLRNAVVLWRDPRDMLVSLYYHCYFINEYGNSLLVSLMKDRSRFDDYSDIRTNLPTFIRLFSTGTISPSFTWPQFAKVWNERPGTVQTSYEALRRDTAGELAAVVLATTGLRLDPSRAKDVAAEFDFQSVRAAAQRSQRGGAEVLFVREGSLGGWKRHFSPESEAAIIEMGYLEPMRALGYDKGLFPSVGTT